jgi:hypothetical protein
MKNDIDRSESLSLRWHRATYPRHLIWRNDHSGPCVLHWIEPCRKQLEKASDYPENNA